MTPTPLIPVACFSKPLTDEKLATYRKIVADQPAGPVRDAMEKCLACVEAWYVLPVSTEPPTKDQWATSDGKTYRITPLESGQIASLDATTPWSYELEGMKELLMALPSGKGEEVAATPTRHAYTPVVDQVAFYLKACAIDLLWHAMEITRDREPITQDVLK